MLQYGGGAVHHVSTIVSNPLWQEWDPRSPASNPSILSYVSNCLTRFVNHVAYSVYCSPLKEANHARNNQDNITNTAILIALDTTTFLMDLQKTFQSPKLFSPFWWPLEFANSKTRQLPLDLMLFILTFTPFQTFSQGTNLKIGTAMQNYPSLSAFKQCLRK